jgi:ATP-binding cassette subfamily C protein
MKLLIALARAKPGRSSIMLLCLATAAIAEGAGLSSLLPLLGLAARAGEAPATATSGFEKAVIDSLSRLGITPTMESLLVLIVAAMTLRSLLLLLANRQVGYTVAQVATDMRLRLLRALLAARWAYFTRQPVGAFANAFATEAARTSQAFLSGVTMISQVFQLAIYTAVAAATSWTVTSVAVPAGLVTVALLSWLVHVTRAAGRQQTLLLQDVLQRLTDVFEGVKPLKVMAREQLVSPLLEGSTQRLNKSLRRQVLAKEAMAALQELALMAYVVIGVYVTVTYMHMEVSVIFMLVLLFVRALISLNKAQRQYQTMAADESAYWSMLRTIESAEAERELWSGTRTPRLEAAIELRRLTFRYGDKTILEEASLVVPAGGITALIGASGSGKTTVVDLVTGLARPASGSILVDGVPLEDLDLNAWRRMIGYVPQETFLLHESVERNVSLGDPAVSREDVERALRQSGAWEFVGRLAQGIETFVGEHGLQLSGGERQRIAIARALVRRPRLLILDEATAALDEASEKIVWEKTGALRGETTILAIGHQPRVLEIADRIYRIDARRVLELPPQRVTVAAR